MSDIQVETPKSHVQLLKITNVLAFLGLVATHIYLVSLSRTDPTVTQDWPIILRVILQEAFIIYQFLPRANKALTFDVIGTRFILACILEAVLYPIKVSENYLAALIVAALLFHLLARIYFDLHLSQTAVAPQNAGEAICVYSLFSVWAASALSLVLTLGFYCLGGDVLAHRPVGIPYPVPVARLRVFGVLALAFFAAASLFFVLPLKTKRLGGDAIGVAVVAAYLWQDWAYAADSVIKSFALGLAIFTSLVLVYSVLLAYKAHKARILLPPDEE